MEPGGSGRSLSAEGGEGEEEEEEVDGEGDDDDDDDRKGSTGQPPIPPPPSSPSMPGTEAKDEGASSIEARGATASGRRAGGERSGGGSIAGVVVVEASKRFVNGVVESDRGWRLAPPSAAAGAAAREHAVARASIASWKSSRVRLWLRGKERKGAQERRQSVLEK